MAAEIVKLLGTADDTVALQNAARRLRDGQIVIIPTESVYGAAGLMQTDSLAKLKEIRGTDDSPPTPHLYSTEQAEFLVGPPTELVSRLMKKLWPGPVGLVFDVLTKIRAGVASKLKLRESDIYHDGSITLRCPDHAATFELLRSVDAPVAAISASIPWTRWIDKVDLILDAGSTRYARPSTLIKITPNEAPGYRIIRAGVYDARIIEKMLKTTILFVCSGNTCRSPMAEALTRKIIAGNFKIAPEKLGEKGYIIGSAGVVAANGSRAATPAIAVVEQLGGDLSAHRSRLLTPELIHQADAIFVMGQNHRRALLAMSPGSAAKVHLLDPEGDIEDPIGGDVALYLSLAQRLNTLIADRLSALKLI